jgi:hypothetical protein
MSEKLLLLAGAAAAAAVGALPAEAAPASSLAVSSYAELLQPIPDAREKIAAMDAQKRAPTARVELAQYYHHHHHHHHWRRWYHHHHWYRHHHRHHHWD